MLHTIILMSCLQYSICYGRTLNTNASGNMFKHYTYFPANNKIMGFEGILHFLQAQIWLTSVYILKPIYVIGQGSM